ncbi:MAG: Y-family DNA polymerase [Candidatus Cloacimonetes bacterium]|nr:Y-family DNA polymerase [Candidatus Cloacimonadota bacterium]
MSKAQKVFALVDCNSFYASCERVFRPDLKGKPIGVLSNNDGCIVALSHELKKLGIQRGVPAFKIRNETVRHKITLFSSNYALYGDLSARVMSILSQFTPELEIYSIDEAFLSLTGFAEDSNLLAYGREIKETVEKCTGVPISVGIATTKTLAKIANHVAKKYRKFNGVFNLAGHPQMRKVLESISVKDIWGVGFRYSKMLNKRGIFNAWELSIQPDMWVLEKMTIIGMRTIRELRGEPCIELDMIQEPKKGIVSSKSFSKPVTNKQELYEAVAQYTVCALDKLRRQSSVAHDIMVFLTTNPFKDESQYANYISGSLPTPSAYVPEFITLAKDLMNEIYKDGYRYKKAGVMISGIESQYQAELDFFQPAYVDDYRKKVMDTIDYINKRLGKDKITFAAVGVGQEWSMRREFLSRNYTTSWNELPIVKA